MDAVYDDVDRVLEEVKMPTAARRSKQRVAIREDLVASCMESALGALGVDLTDENFADTPERWARGMMEFFQHKEEDLVAVLKEGFISPARDHGMVVQENIPLRALCPHHLLPVLGTAAIGYVPRKRIVGLSKLARLVEVAGTIRPCTQEQLTDWIADALYDTLDPSGVVVVTRAMHTCMCARGVKTPDVFTSVSNVRGIFRDVPAAREEFFHMIGR